MDKSSQTDATFSEKVLMLLSEKGLNSEFDFWQFARSLNVSKSTLYRRINAYFGMSPVEMITLHRLENACELLSEEELSISEIAYRTGFSDPKYFCRSFKAKYGMPPSDFRRYKYNIYTRYFRDSSFSSKALMLIRDECLCNAFNFSKIADRLGVSKSTLYRCIAFSYDISPIELVTNIRLEHACALLSEESNSIFEVAYQSGYNDPRYFCTCFKNKYGMSPSDYRRSGLGVLSGKKSRCVSDTLI